MTATLTLERTASTETSAPASNTEMRSLAVARHLAQQAKDAQLAAAAPDEAALAQLAELFGQGACCNEMLAAVCRLYGARDAFGHSMGGAAGYSYTTYKQLWERVQTLAAGMCTGSLARQYSSFLAGVGDTCIITP